MMRAGTFPAAVQISPNRIGWRLSDLEEWKRQRPLARSLRAADAA
jgi:predicted DNA-binding transcriptional regulator AlpA